MQQHAQARGLVEAAEKFNSSFRLVANC